MAHVNYIEQTGRVHRFNVRKGASVMEGAVKNNVPGIDADCGGACACGTCHVVVDEAWRKAAGDPSDMELGMLDIVLSLQPGSRLSCQIKVSDTLDGLIVYLPVSQR